MSLYVDQMQPSIRNNEMFALIDKNTNRAYMFFGSDMIEEIKEKFPDKDIIYCGLRQVSEAMPTIIKGKIQAFTMTQKVMPYNDYHFIRTTPVGMSTEEAYELIS